MFNIGTNRITGCYSAVAGIAIAAVFLAWFYFAATGASRQLPCDLLYRQLAEAENAAQTLAPDNLIAACAAAAREYPDKPRYSYFYGKALTLVNQYAQAIDLFSGTAQAGYAPAQYELGIINLYGRGVPYHPEAARHWLRAAAANSYAPAQYRLGEMYLIGEGGDRDSGQAIRWLTRAAGQDFAEAQYSLAMAYRTHPELDDYQSKALHWLRAAAGQNNASAQYVLANEYLRGEIVRQDYARALDWMQKAADNGYGAAEKGLFSSGFCAEVSAALQ